MRPSTIKLLEAKRLQNSRDGNPRWDLTFELGTSLTFSIVTKSDAQIGYMDFPSSVGRSFTAVIEDGFLVSLAWGETLDISDPCECEGCWACSGQVPGCTCHVDWDALAEENREPWC